MMLAPVDGLWLVASFVFTDGRCLRVRVYLEAALRYEDIRFIDHLRRAP